MTKNILRLTLSAGLLLLTGVMVLLANYINPVIFSFYPGLSRGAIKILAEMTSVFPVPLWELLLIAGVLWFLISLIRAIIRKAFLRWVTGVLLVVCIGVTAFLGLWGLNYYAPPMQERLGLTHRQYTREELLQAAAYYRDKVNETAASVRRNPDGTMADCDFRELSDAAGEGYEVLAQTMDCFDGSTVGVKKLLSSPLMGKLGTTGVFLCLTGESCVSTTTYTASLPFTMCHEIGHRMAFAREDEANFAAFLACSASSRPEFLYSGYYQAFRYCYNSLCRIDAAAAGELWQGLSPPVQADYAAATRHYNQLEEKKVSQVTDKVYDTYLKSFSVESGIQSYGEVTDLLLAWYFDRLQN